VNVTTPDGRTLVVREAGDAEGFPILVHHGTPCLGLLYDGWVEDGVRLISYDRPGYGGSTRAPGRAVASCAADVEAIADALELPQLATWGVSGGGPHALACAALLPDRVVAAAALCSPAPHDAEELDWAEGMGAENIAEFAAAEQGAAALESYLSPEATALADATGPGLAAAIESLLAPVDREILVGGEVADYLAATMKGALAHGIDGWLDDDLAFVGDWGFDLGAIETPVLIRQGEQDRFVPVAHARWLAEHVAGAEARITAEDGHLTLYERAVPGVHAWLRREEGFPVDRRTTRG